MAGGSPQSVDSSVARSFSESLSAKCPPNTHGKVAGVPLFGKAGADVCMVLYYLSGI